MTLTPGHAFHSQSIKPNPNRLLKGISTKSYVIYVSAHFVIKLLFSYLALFVRELNFIILILNQSEHLPNNNYYYTLTSHHSRAPVVTMKLQFIASVAVMLLNSNMKLSYIFSLLPLVAANDGYLYEGRHHLRRGRSPCLHRLRFFGTGMPLR